MKISETLLPEFDEEMKKTRKVLERVPDGKPDWRPHPKSMALGYMAVHLSMLPEWTNMTLGKSELDIAAARSGAWKMPDFESAAKCVETFDTKVAAARKALAAAGDDEMMQPWTLKNGDQVYFTAPKLSVLRGMVMNHIIHHRGQLTVYLRLNDVPLPQLYGPTADEPM